MIQSSTEYFTQTMDDLDKRLCQLLEKNARQSSDALAKKLHVSPATVRRRINNLIKENIIRIVAVVDPTKVGFPLAALLLFEVRLDMADAAIQALAQRPEIRWLSTNSGRYNVVAVAQFLSTDEFANFTKNELSKIEGIVSYEASFILKREKSHYVLGVF